MKSFLSFFWILLLVSFLMPAGGHTQTDPEIKLKVDDLVGKHYMDGVPYASANALGSQSLPYLFELLEDQSQKPYWVNIIVTIGFIEDSSAILPLLTFLETPVDEVDSFSFRALLSIPYALGCIASNGSTQALDFLGEKAENPDQSPLRWTFRGKPIDQIISEQSVMALAVSGRPEARQVLENLQTISVKSGDKTSNAFRKGVSVNQGLMLMDRIKTNGRARVLNPQREE